MRVSAFMLLGGAGLALYGLLRGLAPMTRRGRVYVSGGILHGPNRSVRLTDTDMLWLARALVGETGGTDERAMAAVAWTLAQNMLVVLRGAPFVSFSALIRAYSIPVKAAAADPASSWCAEHPDLCTPRLLQRRRDHQAMTWAQVPSATKLVIAKFRRGTLDNPVASPEAVDFAAFRFSGATQNIGGNWFGVGSSRRVV